MRAESERAGVRPGVRRAAARSIVDQLPGAPLVADALLVAGAGTLPCASGTAEDLSGCRADELLGASFDQVHESDPAGGLRAGEVVT